MKSVSSLFLTLLLIMCTACIGTIQIGIERTFTPDAAATRSPNASPQASGTASSVAPLVTQTPRGAESVFIYRQGTSLYALDKVGNSRQLLDLPEEVGHLALSLLGYLAYVHGDTAYLADLSTGTVHAFYQATGRAVVNWSWRWSSDGRALVYALTWNEPDGSYQVELGTYDGYQGRTVSLLTARPAGPTPTLPAEPPAPPEPGFTSLALLAYDRAAGRILAAPIGGVDRYKVVWSFDANSGDQTTALSLSDSDAKVVALAASGDLSSLAVSRTSGQVTLYDLTDPQAEPRSCSLPANTHTGPLYWSSDGTLIASLIYEGQEPGLEIAPTRGLWVLEVGWLKAHELLELESPEADLLGWQPDNKALLVRFLDALSRQTYYRSVNLTNGQAHDLLIGGSETGLGWATLRD